MQLLSVRIREELEEGVLEGILEAVELVVGLVVGEGVGRCDICTDQDIRLLKLMRIYLLFKERELLGLVGTWRGLCLIVVSFRLFLSE